MKNLLLLSTLLFCSFFIQAQKKTHDHEKFVKKVTLSLAPSLITKWLPDDEAINYVASKTNKTEAQLKRDLDQLSEQVKEDAQFIIDNGIYANKYNKISVNVRQEKPVRIADIVLHCEFKGDVFDITLKDCIQTDQSWYLGGRIIPSGDGIKGAIAKQEERKNKPQGGLLGKIEKLEEKTEAEAEQSSDRMIYEAKRFPMVGTDASSQFVQHDKIGQTLDGYYIDQDYKKVETKIKYEAPEVMMDPNMSIEINGYDIVKSNFKAFYVADQMYVFTGEYWDILVKEGAIRKLARVVKNEETGNYVLGELVQKLEMGPENIVSFAMGFKNKMAELVSDNEQMATKVKNKEDGYKFKDIDKILNEYNAWFDQQYPGKAEYLLERVNGINNGGSELNNATAEQLGKELFNALMSEKAENFKLYIYTKAEVEKSSMKDEFKEKLFEQMETPKGSEENWYGEKVKITQLIEKYKETNPRSVQLVNVETKKNESESEEVGIEIVQMYIHLTVNGEKRNFRMDCAKFNKGWKVVHTSPFLRDPSEAEEEAAEVEEIPGEVEEGEEAEEASAPDYASWSEGKVAKAYLNAISEGNTNSVLSMIKSDDRITVNSMPFYSKKPLLHAIQSNQFEIARVLIKDGADVKIKNGSGQSALHLLVQPLDEMENPNDLVYHNGLAADLIENGLDVNLKDERGFTALHYLAMDPHYSVIEHFVETFNPDLTIKNMEGQTAQEMVKGSGDSKIVELLAP